MNEALQIAILAVQQYASMHPRPAHWTQAQVCKEYGISPNTLRAVLRKEFGLNSFGRIPVDVVDRLVLDIKK
jgi:AraC-like DNA-binding protein